MLFAIRPTETAHRLHRRFGDVFTVKLQPTGPFAYVADPAAAREVFGGDPELLHAGESNRMLEPVNGSSSVVVLDEERHARARKVLLPLFRPAQLATHRGLIERVVEREVASWPLNRPFALSPRMQNVSLEVILRVTLGEEPRVVVPLKRLLPELLRVNTLTWLPGLHRNLGPLSPAGRLRRLTAAFDRILLSEIARRREAEAASPATSLDHLLAFEDEGGRLSNAELRDHIATLLLAGHETTSSSLSWAFERVLRHPATVSRLRRDLEKGDESYLEAVVKEVLRTRPSVMDTGRVLKADSVIAGRHVPSEAQVRIAISLIHKRADLFRQPEEFCPERFLEGEVSPADWMPFGGGARRCLGAALAMLEMKVTLATALTGAELRPDRPKPERAAFRRPHLTLSPARGCRAVLERRLG